MVYVYAIALKLDVAARFRCLGRRDDRVFRTRIPVISLPAQATAPTITVPISQPEKSEARTQTPAEPIGFTQQQLATSSPVDAVAELIARVDKEYQTGIDHQRAGRLDAARKSFNQAFELLLMSKFDVHSDDRLETGMRSVA